ncbi:MAG: hypothetical protein Ct9H300mP1_00010 [Planctomycetaceae bacterium]|nr:MAG: hypothetical protein Ct9H300mP1_00010 [Planctomycetaceae bacterium]
MRSELGFTGDDVVIGKIARLFDLKGHRFLLEAAGRIAAACPQAKFLLVGDGPLRSQFEDHSLARAVRPVRVGRAGSTPAIPELIHAKPTWGSASLWEGLARVLPQSMLRESRLSALPSMEHPRW